DYASLIKLKRAISITSMLLKGSYFHSTVHLLDFGNQIQLEITVKVPIFRFKRFYLIISYLY
ncbi:hypothetical protein, partial [Enterococcus faecium]|uniref:hypothetical protein n=1 Tax=Enterococcus faecium TaxID=1352 RepID=UPI0034E96619